jgi:hypothetical protein
MIEQVVVPDSSAEVNISLNLHERSIPLRRLDYFLEPLESGCISKGNRSKRVLKEQRK